MDDVRGQVHVFPAQPEDLAHAQPEGHGHGEEGFFPRTANLRDQGLGLTRCQWADLGRRPAQAGITAPGRRTHTPPARHMAPLRASGKGLFGHERA